MSKKEDGGAAFPREFSTSGDYTDSPKHPAQTGMTLRDYFAAKAIAALIGFPDKMDINRGANAVPKLAAWAYEYADAMLAERAK